MKKIHKINKKKLLILTTIVSVVFVIAIVAMSQVVANRKDNFEPPKGVDFGIWYPSSKKSGYTIQAGTKQYDKTTKTVVFKLQNKSNNQLTFSQQAVPESIAVLPEAFDEQLENLPQVTKFDSVNGQVAITKPSEGGQPTAIMRSKGTIVYVYSKDPIQTNDWRVLFNDLELKR